MIRSRRRVLLAVHFGLALALGIAACGEGGDIGDGGEQAANRIEKNPDNAGIQITVGSKNFSEQIILGEIYAQALEAAGYDVEKRLKLGPERVALRALQGGEIDAYPEYTSTALTSFVGFAPQNVPADAQRAYEASRPLFERRGLTTFPPTPFSSANAVGLLTERADELDVTSVSDLEGLSDQMRLYGSPECRRRVDCLVGLRDNYGLRFKSFTPVDIDRRYAVLDSGQADLSILFTTDAQLFVSDEYVTLEDDRDVLPAGNVLFVARGQIVDEAGADLAEVVESVQRELTLEAMQELNARVDIDRQRPEEVARAYLEEFGFVR